MSTATPAPVRVLQLAASTVRVYSAPGALCSAAAEDFFQVVRKALDRQPRCNVALAGGSTPRSLYALIALRAAEDDALRDIAWERVHFFFGDERCVPPEHPDSNFRMVTESLLARATFPEQNVHRVPAELSPAEAAARYEEELRGHLGGAPAFDLVLLGMGADGHTASLFPGTIALDERQRWAVENPVPRLGASRITLTFAVLDAAREARILVTGADKAEMVKAALVDNVDLPVRRVRPQRLEWFLDVAAAGQLGDL